MKRKRSWKTTLGGILAAIGQGFIATKPVGEWSDPAGQILAILGLAMLGFSSRDNNVSSEDAGAK